MTDQNIGVLRQTMSGATLRLHLLTPCDIEIFFCHLWRDNRSGFAKYGAGSTQQLSLTTDSSWIVTRAPSQILHGFRTWAFSGPDSALSDYVSFIFEERPPLDNGIAQFYTRDLGSISASEWCSRLSSLLHPLTV